MKIANNVIKHHLKDIYFIGGTACGGKTTLAKKIAEKYDMIYYNADDAMINHFKIANKEEQPQMSREFKDAEEYFNRPIKEYSKWILDINEEAFDMVLLDLLRLPKDKPIIAEGHFDSKLLKDIIPYNNVIFLFAEDDLILRDYYGRDDKKPMLDAINKLSNPDKVIKHTLDLTCKITHIQLKSVESSGMLYLVRNFESTPEKTLKIAEEHFNLV